MFIISNKSTWVLLGCIFLCGCSSDEEHEPQYAFRAQETFEALDPDQKAYVTKISRQMTPHEAVWQAAEQDILQLPLKDQGIYYKLNTEMKLRYLALDEEASKKAVELAETMNPTQAVQEATEFELRNYPSDQKSFFKTLSPNMGTLFLSLTEGVQVKALVTKNVESASLLDIQRLNANEQAFIAKLSPEDKVCFLAITPEGRTMAIAMTKKLDLNHAVQYAISIQQ